MEWLFSSFRRDTNKNLRVTKRKNETKKKKENKKTRIPWRRIGKFLQILVTETICIGAVPLTLCYFHQYFHKGHPNQPWYHPLLPSWMLSSSYSTLWEDFTRVFSIQCFSDSNLSPLAFMLKARQYGLPCGGALSVEALEERFRAFQHDHAPVGHASPTSPPPPPASHPHRRMEGLHMAWTPVWDGKDDGLSAIPHRPAKENAYRRFHLPPFSQPVLPFFSSLVLHANRTHLYVNIFTWCMVVWEFRMGLSMWDHFPRGVLVPTTTTEPLQGRGTTLEEGGGGDPAVSTPTGRRHAKDMGEAKDQHARGSSLPDGVQHPFAPPFPMEGKEVGREGVEERGKARSDGRDLHHGSTLEGEDVWASSSLHTKDVEEEEDERSPPTTARSAPQQERDAAATRRRWSGGRGVWSSFWGWGTTSPAIRGVMKACYAVGRELVTQGVVLVVGGIVGGHGGTWLWRRAVFSRHWELLCATYLPPPFFSSATPSTFLWGGWVESPPSPPQTRIEACWTLLQKEASFVGRHVQTAWCETFYPSFVTYPQESWMDWWKGLLCGRNPVDSGSDVETILLSLLRKEWQLPQLLLPSCPCPPPPRGGSGDRSLRSHLAFLVAEQRIFQSFSEAWSMGISSGVLGYAGWQLGGWTHHSLTAAGLLRGRRGGAGGGGSGRPDVGDPTSLFSDLLPPGRPATTTTEEEEEQGRGWTPWWSTSGRRRRERDSPSPATPLAERQAWNNSRRRDAVRVPFFSLSLGMLEVLRFASHVGYLFWCTSIPTDVEPCLLLRPKPLGLRLGERVYGYTFLFPSLSHVLGSCAWVAGLWWRNEGDFRFRGWLEEPTATEGAITCASHTGGLVVGFLLGFVFS